MEREVILRRKLKRKSSKINIYFCISEENIDVLESMLGRLLISIVILTWNSKNCCILIKVIYGVYSWFEQGYRRFCRTNVV